MRPTALALALALPLAAHAAGDTEIHLTETATETLKPDRLRANLQIEVKGGTPRNVQSDLNKRMAAALDQAKAVAGVTSSTGGYEVFQTVTPDKHELWQANETLILSSADTAAVLTLAGALQSAGLALSGLEFYLAPETVKAAEAALTQSALAGLRARALAVADDLGRTIDHYDKIEIGNAVANGGPIRPMPLRLNAMAAAAPPPVAAAADETVSLTVSGDIALAPAR